MARDRESAPHRAQPARGGQQPDPRGSSPPATSAAAGRTKALGRIATPTLLLWGEDDDLVPVMFGRAAAAAIPGSELVVLPGVGHIPSIDAPRDFVRILTDFAAGRPVA